jgi:hypothetical protein
MSKDVDDVGNIDKIARFLYSKESLRNASTYKYHFIYSLMPELFGTLTFERTVILELL